MVMPRHPARRHGGRPEFFLGPREPDYMRSIGKAPRYSLEETVRKQNREIKELQRRGA